MQVCKYVINVKVRQSLSHKAVILSLSKLFIELKNFFYKNCSFWYDISECCLKSDSLAVNWSHSGHFVTFRTKHQIKKFFYKRSLIWYAIWECHKKSKSYAVIWFKAVILSLSKLNVESKNFFYKTCSVWYVTWECGIKSESLAVLWLSSSHFITF